ncbi:hypothetical protein [Acidovorax sp. ACV01]|uniref:hypothetical protein n=1 Tax=Acidovorax sp. ACV01 TaxID=2769311 RepID=UPI00177E91C0|nr:hypothetical protein [Acidovorax sp. ACV01]MBD9395171.1 hypothetical protein [Acidovorax sp. ACV01]
MNRQQRREAQHKHATRRNPSRWQANPTAAFAVILERSPMRQEDMARSSNVVRTAWHHLCNGTGTTDHFDAVATAMNICLVRSESIGEDAIEVAQRAQAAMVAMQQRYLRCARLGPDAAALAAVPVGLDLYDELLRMSSPLQLETALAEVSHRITHGDVLAPAH